MTRLGFKAVIIQVTLLTFAWVSPARAAEPQNDDAGWFDEPAAAESTANAPAAPRPRPAQAAPQPVDPVETDPRAVTDFKPTLDPYGQWVQDPTYGLVWVPDRSVVGADFAPYVTSGHWALDDAGNWVWVSSYPFGEVVFHYGRWVWISGSGWAWIPGYRYAPAWVVWRVPTGSYAYVGWAPMPPTWGWYGGVAFWIGYPAYYPYVFCPSGYFFHRHVHRYIVHDRALIPRLAAETRRYDTPASVRSVPRAPESRVISGPAAYTRNSPSFEQARIPRNTIPAERVRPTSRISRSPVAARAIVGERFTPAPSASPSRFRDTRTAVPMTRPTPTMRSTPVRTAPNRSYTPARAPRAAEVRSTPRFNAERPRMQPRSAAPVRSAPVVRSRPAFEGTRFRSRR